MHSLTLLPGSLLAVIAVVCAQEATTLPSGLQIEYTTPVSCSRPSKSGDSISVNYRGTLQDTGVVFDESYKRGVPFNFKLGAGQVIAGWDQGLMDMCPGEGRKLTIPPNLAYGDRGVGPIGPGATLVFETEMVDIVGVKQESLTFASTSMMATATGDTFSIATAPATPPGEEEGKDELTATPLEPQGDEEAKPEKDGQPAECHLLGPFALLVQGALGAVAVLSLVLKRYRESPKRPWRIWFFDVSKQIFGSMLLHVFNIAMSLFATTDVVNAAKTVVAQSSKDANGRSPNPCSFYLLNLGIDTTIGIPTLYVLLQVLHAIFLKTALARPAESIKSGNYGQPPKATWWAKQLLIYFLGLTGMKLFVFFLFAALPWLPWIGDWALRWTEGNEALEIAFVMFIFPLAMNAAQYWIIDSFIKGKSEDKEGRYQEVQGEDELGEDHDEHGSMLDVDEDAAILGKRQVEEQALQEVNPTPIDSRSGEGSGSRNVSPIKVGDEVERRD
ncbi:hypothetical protein LTR91_001093 [Friedmanniomyces endolithicus]|uniref:peptidylprolyl isomerase n=1 Tax=Friedmanniomyces endolithicus TaxID=329885 RepID=A0AAN6R249_9PEZI|nr:hypothetical protein LTR57_007228 [Friedmanniomyces endolithicus]KAK1011410.1 hypothetical protein LTS01_001266 [Friedmanniomyces endolithicus]KAK1014230.1 hypothetical protein LTR91_001093 [Friedmanniomyces endolithicus]KAK1040791.1 hypothetical protein LTS16_010082 [Friedmanniomyces endolithicus]